MTAKLNVLDAFLDCLHVIEAVRPSERYKVIAALHRMMQSTEGSRVLASPTLDAACGCCYEDCDADADVLVGTQSFCRYHAADGLLAGMDAETRAGLVSIRVSSDELVEAEVQP